MTEEFNQEMKNPVMEFQDEAFKQETKIQEGDLQSVTNQPDNSGGRPTKTTVILYNDLEESQKLL